MRKMKRWLLLFITVAVTAGSMIMPVRAFTDETAEQEAEEVVVVQEETPVEPEPIIEEEAPPQTEETPFSVPGNGNLVDDKLNDSSKQFLTVQTKNGNTFFLVIDRSGSSENVYMLSMIDENDLAEFVETKEEPEVKVPVIITPEPQATPEPEKLPEESEEKTQDAKNGAILTVILCVAAGAVGFYFKVIKPKKENQELDNEDLEFYDAPYINEDVEDKEKNEK